MRKPIIGDNAGQWLARAARPEESTKSKPADNPAIDEETRRQVRQVIRAIVPPPDERVNRRKRTAPDSTRAPMKLTGTAERSGVAYVTVNGDTTAIRIDLGDNSTAIAERIADAVGGRSKGSTWIPPRQRPLNRVRRHGR